MSQFEKILHRGPVIDDVESERVRVLAVARLSMMSAHPAVDGAAPPMGPAPIIAEPIGPEPADPSTIWDAPTETPPADEAADEAAPADTLVAVGPGPTDESPPPEPDPAATLEPSTDPEPADPPVVATAYCPSCAFLLDPAPAHDRACPRCDRPIVVRVLGDGRLVYLTEAAIEVFEAERIREENERRWTEEQAAWLSLAATVGVPMAKIERLGRTGPSESAVAAARELYLTASEAAAEQLMSGGAWDVAAGLRRSQADDLHRIAGRPMPPEADAVERYRRAALTELRGIGTITRSAAVLSARCCEECRADDGTVVRISTEVRRTRLPHPGCPEVLCGCRWDLAPADVQALVRYLERTGRPLPDVKGQTA